MRFSLEMINTKGLHARASAKFVEVVEGFQSRVTVSKDGYEASGDSIMGLMSLGAAWGTSVDIQIDGPDADAVARALTELVAGRFGEET